MTAKKSMAPKRKGQKQYPLVSFEFEGFEGDFVLPKLDALPLGVAADLSSGGIGKLMAFLEKNAPDSAGAVEDLSGEEAELFMQAWGNASGVEAGK